ncbi:hypothetical protein [Paracoccus sp. MC1854]|nr:hypothetical protein [Paracoccus sp. MC1854]
MREKEAEHGNLPQTVSVKSPFGGLHYYFNMPDFAVRNFEGKIGTGWI